MMTDAVMTVAQGGQIARAVASLRDFRETDRGTAVDPASPCADASRRGLQRIADTLDAVPFVTLCNLANLNTAMRGGLLDLIEVRLMCGRWWPDTRLCRARWTSSPCLSPMIEKVRQRMLNDGRCASRVAILLERIDTWIEGAASPPVCPSRHPPLSYGLPVPRRRCHVL